MVFQSKMNLCKQSVNALRKICKASGMKKYSKIKKDEMIKMIESIDCDANVVSVEDDSYDLSVLKSRLTSYIQYLSNCIEHQHQNIRRPNFPEDISENIVKFVIREKIDKTVKRSKTGDLESQLEGQIEVKCFSAVGPTSFGPTEKWSTLYFLDATRCLENYYTVYRIALSNNSDCWKNISINKSETYQDHCQQKRRPRINWNDIKKQLPTSEISIVFSGYL